MNVAQHAEQILAAWRRADSNGFEQKLDDAMRCCEDAAPANYFESEQREVLASVVERLRLVKPERRGQRPVSACNPQSLHAGLSLLEHLCHRAAA